MDNQFTKNPHGTNELLKITDSIYISYNSNPGSGIRMFESDNGSSETALCIDGEYFILNGDFREQYLACNKDIQKIKQVYIDNMDTQQSTWSSDRTNDEKFNAFFSRIV